LIDHIDYDYYLSSSLLFHIVTTTTSNPSDILIILIISTSPNIDDPIPSIYRSIPTYDYDDDLTISLSDCIYPLPFLDYYL